MHGCSCSSYPQLLVWWCRVCVVTCLDSRAPFTAPAHALDLSLPAFCLDFCAALVAVLGFCSGLIASLDLPPHPPFALSCPVKPHVHICWSISMSCHGDVIEASVDFPGLRVPEASAAPPRTGLETRDQISASFLACPAHHLALGIRLSGASLSGRDRVARAWTAGLWAKAVLEGRVFTPNRTPPLDLRSHFYAWTVDTADFMKCSETTMHDNVTAYTFFKISGDTDGVVITEENGVKTYKLLCQDEYFWRPSSCRSDPSKCVVFVTGGDGWDIPHAPQRAAAYNMPFAIGVAASWSKYLEVPGKYKSMYFYWWTPDDSFIEMQPTKLILPTYDAYAWTLSDYTTAAADIKTAKIVPKDLTIMAPDVVKLLAASLFDSAAVDSMMLNMKTNSLTREQAACAWLKGNDVRWNMWIPDSTKCDPGFGLYDDATEVFTAQRTTATTCRACLPGMLSKAYSDDSGPTYVCEACPAGQQQLGAGEMACDPCPLGTSKLNQSPEECALCPAGQYQDEEGAFQCKKCPPGTTTMILGMKSISGCGCKAGSIDVSDLNSPLRTAADCQACTAGLDCPTMSTVAALKAGVSPVGEEFTPMVIEGYFSTESKPIELFKCSSPVECPGGKPDTCGGDRIGVPCGECPAATYWAGSKCSGCTAWSAIGWILCIALIFAGLVGAYYFLNSAVTAKASTLVSTTCAVGMMINMLQSLGIIGTMTVGWPVSLKGIWGFLQVFTFDIDGFAFACIAGENPVARYILLVLFFPAGLLWLSLCGLVSKVKAKWAWDTTKLRSTMGQFMQARVLRKAAAPHQTGLGMLKSREDPVFRTRVGWQRVANSMLCYVLIRTIS
ncbi:unnamed protein product [Cladocopium goreaui]|uniref:Tyrosine-protein kinase ephrin type A/B receptor-like domain-containing protein n=1 Tax=Cladocopium goreaui TaxID=2562237 RepID=A0A9P1C2S7_9DINO|nr:unnamed protein product [Cladocopium goreaui]